MLDRRPDNPRVQVVVLNWNGLANTRECLESLGKLAYDNFEVMVVDNGSSDGSPALIRREFPETVVVENGRNYGYAGGNNIGIRQAVASGAEYILVLNNDIMIDPRCICELVKAAALYPDAGVFGPKVYHLSDPRRLSGGVWKQGGPLWWSSVTHRELDVGQFESVSETDFVEGCALFFHRDVVAKVGLFDERFFAYFEEVDWCYRVRGVGYRCLFIPQAVVWHKIGATSQKINGLERYYKRRNVFLWMEKHVALRKRLRVFCRTAREVHWDLRGWLSPRSPGDYRWQCRVSLQGFLDYILRRFGPAPPWITSRRQGRRST